MTKAKEPEIAGHLYYKSSLRGPTAQVYPAGTDTPVGSYLAKFPLTADEMKMSILLLEKRYPYQPPEQKG